MQLDLKELEIQKSIEDFEIRYGPKSDRINPLELLLINYVPPFRGSPKGPSPWEPITRWTPFTFNASDGHPMMAVQLGANFYFLSDACAPLQMLNHVGLAIAAADPEGTSLFDVKLARISPGFVLHTGRGQVGAFYSRETRKVKIMSTLDFQLVPGVF